MPADASQPPSSSSEGDFAPGQVLIGRYRIIALVGEGGMGQVYRADDLVLGQPVAIKFLPEHVAEREDGLERFRSEVRHAREVSHPNVARVHDIGEIDGRHFLTMEFVDGEDLASLIRRIGRLPREKASQIAQQICAALGEAHRKGVLHRDLKPANVMLDGEGQVRLTDFGLAVASEGAAEVSVAGTPPYMAPEQLMGVAASVRSEIYSLGLLLYELYTGKRALRGQTLDELRREHEEGGPDPPSSRLADIEPNVEAVLNRCLVRDPLDRPGSVREVARALPGGDPLAAALAAGKTPSPELVASARSARLLGPRVVTLLVLWVVGSVIAGAFWNQSRMRFPERATSELAVVAGEIATRELGLSELPAYSASGLILNPNRENEGVRPYAVWRRWSPEPIEPEDFHFPEIIGLHAPPRNLPGSVAVFVDDTGTLIEASVIAPPDAHDPPGEVELDLLLARAGIDAGRVTVEDVDPAMLEPPLRVHTDRATVWRDESNGKVIARAGMNAGRMVAFQRVGHAPDLRHTWAGSKVETTDLVLMVAYAVMLVVAIRNLRLGRGDRRGALRAALVMLGATFLIEISAFDLDQDLLGQILELFQGSPAGHVLLHAVEVGIIYLAFEPIARRVWPRVLIGWARLAEGRLRDPRVGAEVLIGLAAACVVIWETKLGNALLGGRAESWQERWEDVLRALAGPATASAGALHSVSIALFFTMFGVAFIATLYVLTRSRWAPLAAPAVLLGLLGGLGSDGGLGAVVWPILGTLTGALVVAVLVRGGLIAVFVFAWLFFRGSTRVHTLTTDLSAWYAPYTVFNVLLVLLLLAYGAWAALAGRQRLE